jgi:hypothetical protein
LGAARERAPVELDVSLNPAGPGGEPRRRQSDFNDEAPAPGRPDPVPPAPPPADAADGSARWEGEGGASDHRGGPTTPTGEAARDPEGNPELM